MAIRAQRSCCGSNRLCLWMLSGGSAEHGCTSPEHQWDADNNTVSHIAQNPASGLFYWIFVCLERGKYPLLEADCLMVCVVIKGDRTPMETVSFFSCKVAASLSVDFIYFFKKACFGSGVAKEVQDAWQAACPREKCCHSSRTPPHLAVRSHWVSSPSCPLCAHHKLATVALWDPMLGTPVDGKHTRIFQASEWTWLSACLESSVFFTTLSQSLRQENWDVPARAWRWLFKWVINTPIYLLVCICQMPNSVITLFKYFLQA